MALYRHRIQNDNWNYFKDILFFYQSFSLYNKQINNFIETEVKNAKEKYEQYKKEMTYDDFGDFALFDHESDMEATSGLVDIYYDSLIMTLYSFTERKMYFLCNYLSQNFQVKVEDIAGRGIYKYRKYLSKVCGIDFSPIEKDWVTLDDYNKLRNHLVHSEGNRSVLKTNNQLINILKKINGIEISDQNNYINFHFSTDDVTIDFINCSQRIIDYLYKEKYKGSHMD